MMFRKTLLLFATAAMMLLPSCTARYQDMLREKDSRIRELNGEVARLRGENDDLQRRLASAPTVQPTPASAKREDSELKDLQKDVGPDAYVDRRRGRISIGVQDKVTFDSGSTTLKDTSHSVLRNVANVLKDKFSGHRFYIEGHTDTDPIVKTKNLYRSNRHLSLERADSVAAYLIKQGVPESSIVVVGYGQFDPRDPKTKAANRRVEIVVGDTF